MTSYTPRINQALANLPNFCQTAVDKDPKAAFLGIQLSSSTPQEKDDGIAFDVYVYVA